MNKAIAPQTEEPLIDPHAVHAREDHSVLDRLCRLFTEVRPGEGKTGVMLFGNVMLILVAYYLIKPLREGWIAQEHLPGLTKWEIKAYSSYGQSLLLVGIVALYDRMVNLLPRGRLIAVTTLCSMAVLLAFWLLQPGLFVGHIPGLGILFYLCVGIFGGFMVAQSWTFAVDLYNDERGRRLLPMIAIGATSGAVVGSWLVERLLALPGFKSETLLLVVHVPLLLTILLTRIVNDRHQRSGPGHAPGAEEAVPRPGKALQFILHNRFLFMVAVITLILNWVNTNGENLLFRVVSDVLDKEALARGITETAAKKQFIKHGVTAFYGNFFFWVNVSALALQAFVASRLLKYGGFAMIILLLPLLVLTASVAMTLLPVLAIIKVMKIAENATDYSINNTARHVLWLPFNHEVKFKAKPAIDSFFVRMGDGLAALTVLVGGNLLALSNQALFGFNVMLVTVWLAATLVVVREHRRITAMASLRDEVY